MAHTPGGTKFLRLREIAAVMARHGFAPTMRRMPGVRPFATSAADEKLLEKPIADRFTAVLEDLGPTFVKLGQILSTRADLLPPDFVTALSRLQDQVPPFSFTQVQEALRAAWGRPIEEVCASVDETALASASMAQVHTARLMDGSDVVLKVQRPGIAEQIRKDSELLVLVAQLLELIVEEASTYRAVDLVTEFKDALASEVDFAQEARNLQAFARHNADRKGVHVPKLYSELSSRTVLVMERIHGRRITDLQGEPERAARLVERLVELGFEHVFIDGLFHGDPHPGNLLITDNDEVAFIDFGLMGHVSRELQDRMLLLLLALSLRDADTLARLVVRLGEVDGRIELSVFRAAIARLLDRYMGLSVSDVSSAAALTDLIDLSTRFGVRLPRELAVLSKASVSIEGVVRSLHPQLNPSTLITHRAEALLFERLDPRKLKTGGLRTALQLGLVVQELPIQIGQALMDLERGNIQVMVKSHDLQGLGQTLRGVGMTIFGGILAGVAVMVGFQFLEAAGIAKTHGPLLAAISFVVAGGCFGVAFSWYLTGGKLPKITIRRLVSARLRRMREGERAGHR